MMAVQPLRGINYTFRGSEITFESTESIRIGPAVAGEPVALRLL